MEVGFPFLKRYTLMDEYDLDLEGFDDKMAAEEDGLNDDQDEDMTSELGSAEDSEGEGQLPDMDAKEMKAKGFYKVEAILRSKYRHGWRFLVKWEGYAMAEATWEPYTAFILDQGNVSSVFRDYCHANDLQKVLKLAEPRVRRSMKSTTSKNLKTLLPSQPTPRPRARARPRTPCRSIPLDPTPTSTLGPPLPAANEAHSAGRCPAERLPSTAEALQIWA